jgi:hypothetical protein
LRDVTFGDEKYRTIAQARCQPPAMSNVVISLKIL